jgi:uncharacterized membrane protein (DUF4010 family)
MEPALLFARFAAALAVGLLVGLQREYAKSEDSRRKQDEGDVGARDLFAGVRTFALIGLSGALAAHASGALESALVFAAALVVFGGFLAVAYLGGIRAGEIGMTTEAAAFVVFLAGALCVWGHLALAAAVAVATTALLALKPFSKRLVTEIDREDVAATLKFAALAALVLPVLPRAPLGPPPFDAVTPFKVGLMAVFISGLSFVGYVLIQLVGARRGVGLTGVLGGIVSSTAVTLTLAERSRGAEGGALGRALALGILLAWAIMFGRVLVEIGVVNPALLRVAWLPIAAGGAAGLAWAGVLYLRGRPERGEEEPAKFSNPFELKTALQFALLYGVILVVARAAAMYFGEVGVYVSAVASGGADVDAITLSLAELSRGGLDADTATRAIVLAAVSNTLVKGGIVLALGGRAIRGPLLPGVGLMVAAALATAFLL